MRFFADINEKNIKFVNGGIVILMAKIINLRKGLNLRLKGEADRRIERLAAPHSYGITFDDFTGVVPGMLVQPGDRVKAGSPLFFDKNHPQILWSSPVSGSVSEVVRGEKRKLMHLSIIPDEKIAYEEMKVPAAKDATCENIKKAILDAGLWPLLIQRPYGIIANPDDTPKAIFVSGFDTAPLAADVNYIIEEEYSNLLAGVEMLKKLTSGQVHISVNDRQYGVLHRLYSAELHFFRGPHPAGNVGVQINHTDPINKGETVWTLSAQSLAILGRLFTTGKVDMRRKVAVAGSGLINTFYVSTITGASIGSMVLRDNIAPQKRGSGVRIVSGNLLTGSKRTFDGYLGYYDNSVTVIAEGDFSEMFGWARPRLERFSVSRACFSWLMPWRRYSPDTNLNGEVCPLVFSGLYERYLPMDIYPIYLLKAILAGDIDRMEELGIYEVVEEDLALCEFVDPSKTEMQAILRDGINLMIKEMGRI